MKKNNEYKRLYNSKEWQELREYALLRDMYTCQLTGVLLKDGKGLNDNSKLRPAVVDHLIPHKGDEDLFFSKCNVWALSADAHDSICQRIEKKHKESNDILRAKVTHKAIGLDGFSKRVNRKVIKEPGFFFKPWELNPL